MGQHWAWINSAKKEWFNAYAFPSNGGDKYMEHFYSGKFMYPTIMMMMTDTSSYRSSSEDCEAVEDIVGRWSGDKVIFSSDDTKQKRLKLTDKYTCINYLVAPAVLKTLCSDLPKNEVIEFIGSPLENFTDYRYPPIGDGYSPDAAMMKAILKHKGIT